MFSEEVPEMTAGAGVAALRKRRAEWAAAARQVRETGSAGLKGEGHLAIKFEVGMGRAKLWVNVSHRGMSGLPYTPTGLLDRLGSS